MTKQQKLTTIAVLIGAGRAADDIINTCAFTIGRLLGNDELGESSKDYIFNLPDDPSPEEAARLLMEESEGQ